MRRILIVAAAAALCCAPAARAEDYGDPDRLVDYYYRTYLGRAPDPSAAPWVDQLRRGAAPDSVLASILGSDEYYQRAGSTAEGFMRTLFSDVLGRLPTGRERDSFVRRQYTVSRKDLAYELLTQNAGAWVGTFRLSERERDRLREREHERERVLQQERERERDRHRDDHDYRRPPLPFRR